MAVTRREFVRGGVAAFTVGFAAPAFISDLARAQGRAQRNLVVLYLSGGNDALSMLVPYTDPQYYARRPTLAIPAANVLQIGSDRAGRALGLHPRLTGLQIDLRRRPSGDHPAHRLYQLQPLAFPGHRHLVHRRPVVAAGHRMAGPVSGHAAVAGRSADRVVDGPRNPAHAAGAHRRRAVDSERRRLRVRQSELRHRRVVRPQQRAPDCVAPAGRSAAPRPSSTRPRRTPSPRSIGSRRSTPTCRR